MTEPELPPPEIQLALIAAERDRIAGELHDDSVQAMTAVSLQLQRLLARVTDPEDLALIRQARLSADQAIERLRHMLFVLHPSSLGDDGLVITLEIYMEAYVEPAGIDWRVVGDESATFPLGVAALAFRLAREAISNAVKHASPTLIQIEVNQDHGFLVLNVTDNGGGFDASRRRLKQGHMGIRHSQALAEAALGTYRIKSAIGQGTTITITLPTGPS